MEKKEQQCDYPGNFVRLKKKQNKTAVKENVKISIIFFEKGASKPLKSYMPLKPFISSFVTYF